MDAHWQSVDRAPVLAWTFGTPEDRRPWQLAGRRELEEIDGSLRIALGKRPAQLIREVDLDAASIDGFRLRLASDRRLKLRCFWSGPGESLSPERMIFLKDADAGGEPMFDLSSHPLWKGRIARLRFDFHAPPSGTVRLEEILGIQSEVSAAGLAAALRRSWRVDLSNEVRDAWIALPGVAVERRVEIPPAARLRFAFGIESSVSSAVDFQVRARDAEGASHLLFSSTLDAGAGESAAGVWHEASVDLRRFAGQELELALATETAGPFDPLPGLPYWATPEILAAASEPAPINVILISIDTLRADHLSLYGYPRETSPRLDEWARRRAVVFENAVAPAPWTLPSHASMFSGLDALSHGINYNHPASAGLTTLAEILRGHGYRTLAMTGGGWMSPKYGLDQGFDVYRHWARGARGVDEELASGVSTSLAWLEELSGEPFFLFLHTFEVHSPYVPREPWFTRFQGSPPPPETRLMIREESLKTGAQDGFLLRKQFYHFHPREKGHPEKGEAVGPEEGPLLASLYDSGVAYADDQLGRLFDHLDSSGLADRTLVVVTSDHGEALGDRGLASHGYLYDFNLLVPLVFAVPGEGGRRISEQVRVIDILPSVLELAGIEAPSRVDGASLVPLIRGVAEGAPRRAWTYASSSNYGLSLRISNRLKYIYNDTVWAPAHGREELYDLRRDSGEQQNLAADSSETASLRDLARERLARVDHGIRIDFENAGRQSYGGTLGGPPIHPIRVKSPALPAGAVELGNKKSVRFDVDPAERFSVFLAGSAGSTLRVSIEGRGQIPGFETTLDLAELEDPCHISLLEQGWTRLASAPDSPPVASIVVHRLGPAPVVAEDPAETDTQLRDQLRALGYVGG